jgi:hypothetical protein
MKLQLTQNEAHLEGTVIMLKSYMMLADKLGNLNYSSTSNYTMKTKERISA